MKAIEKAQKKKKQDIIVMSEAEVKSLQTELSNELESNPEYSLEVDPFNKYSMSDSQKVFVKAYSEFKSIPMAAELANIDMDAAKAYFIDFNSQQEIRRINRAMYYRQFQSKMLTLDQIGGYLTSLLTDENVAMGDRLKSSDKLRVAGMLIDLINLKQQSMSDPSKIITKNLEVQIKDLSITTIQQLLSSKQQSVVIQNDSLSPEEKEFLSTLSTDELLNMIEETNKSKEDI